VVDIVNMGQTQGIYTIEEFINKIQKENICPEKKLSDVAIDNENFALNVLVDQFITGLERGLFTVEEFTNKFYTND
jgi:ribosomal protein L20